MTEAVEEKAVYSSRKEVSETYHINLESHRCMWARITINESGDFNALTDCGNFNYAWRGFGSQSFKEFLMGICRKSAHGKGSYLYDKIHDDARNKVDCKKTVDPMIQDFIERYKDLRSEFKYRRGGHERALLQMEARNTYEVLKEIRGESTLSHDRFYSILYERSDVSDKFFDGDYIAHQLDVETTGDIQAIAFCEVVMPVFAEILQKELQTNREEEATCLRG